MNPNLTHIPYEQLVDWVEQRLPEDVRSNVAGHLVRCEQCQAEADRVAQVINAMRADESVDAPATLIRNAILAFQKRSEPAQQPSIVQRLVALLRFQSTPLTPTPGLRSGGQAERQLLYAAGDYDLDLRVVPDGNNWHVSGQLFGPVTGAVQAHLSGGALHLQATFTSDEAFSFPSVPAGTYTLVLVTGSAEIAVDDLQLRQL